MNILQYFNDTRFDESDVNSVSDQGAASILLRNDLLPAGWEDWVHLSDVPQEIRLDRVKDKDMGRPLEQAGKVSCFCFKDSGDETTSRLVAYFHIPAKETETVGAN